MPTYEYECLSCGTHFDAFQKMSDSPLDRCLQCKGSVRRIVSGGSGLIFKGSGFYITDYAKGKGKKTETTTAPKNGSKSNSSKPKTADTSNTKKKIAQPLTDPLNSDHALDKSLLANPKFQ